MGRIPLETRLACWPFKHSMIHTSQGESVYSWISGADSIVTVKPLYKQRKCRWMIDASATQETGKTLHTIHWFIESARHQDRPFLSNSKGSPNIIVSSYCTVLTLLIIRVFDKSLGNDGHLTKPVHRVTRRSFTKRIPPTRGYGRR